MNDKETENLIYGAPGLFPEESELFEKVEKALGFRLFYWQKHLIKYGYMRRTGETTAWVLRDLLKADAQPLDYTTRPRNVMEEIYRKELMKTKRILEYAGVPTRTVFTTNEEKRKWQQAQGGREGASGEWL